MNQSKVHGFTFIEVLVALIILSVGLLGLASLQASGVKNNHNALLRSQATMLAHDMADRMRGNNIRVIQGDYTFTLQPDTVAVTRCIPFQPGGQDCCNQTVCTPIQIAGMDIGSWQSLLAQELPGGTGSIQCFDNNITDAFPCSTGSTSEIQVQWTDSGGQSQIRLLVRP